MSSFLSVYITIAFMITDGFGWLVGLLKRSDEARSLLSLLEEIEQSGEFLDE
jgi:hypothetical protein